VLLLKLVERRVEDREHLGALLGSGLLLLEGLPQGVRGKNLRVPAALLGLLSAGPIHENVTHRP
jgi:hypothetical protein